MSISQELFPNNYKTITQYVPPSAPIDFDWTGPFAMTGDLAYQLTGNTVTLVLTGQIASASVATHFTATSLLPTFLWPSAVQDMLGYGVNNGVFAPIDVNVATTGQILVSAVGSTQNFTISQTCGWSRISVSYLI